MDFHNTPLDPCNNWQSYPSNLLKSDYLESELQEYHYGLRDNESNLFNNEKDEWHFLELYDGDDGKPLVTMNTWKVTDSHPDYREQNVCGDKIRGHLPYDREDPRYRYL